MKEQLEKILSPILEIEGKQKELSSKIMNLDSKDLDIVISKYNEYLQNLIDWIDTYYGK